MSAILIRDWRPVRKGALLGFARVELPSGMILADCTVMTGERGPWVSPPSKPMIGRDGTALKDADTGRVKYQPIIEFASREIRDRFSTAVVEALRDAHPEAFE